MTELGFRWSGGCDVDTAEGRYLYSGRGVCSTSDRRWDVIPFQSVSVVLPTRGRPRLLREAVRSVLGQTVAPSEIVVVDDGGGGEAERVLSPIRQAAGMPVRVVEGPGRGPGAARNAGMAEATGELVAFLDDDDLWLPKKLEWQVEWFLRAPSVGVVGTLWTLWTEAEGIEGVEGAVGRKPPRLRRVSRRALMKANRLATSGVVVRRKCVERCGRFDESLALAQDWELWLRMARNWEVGIVPARLVVYRRHEGQRSADRARMRRWEGEVVRRALEGGDLGGRWLEGVGRRRLAWAHGRLGRLLAREGEIKGAIMELRESVNLFPYNPLVWTSLVRCALARRGWAGVKP